MKTNYQKKRRQTNRSEVSAAEAAVAASVADVMADRREGLLALAVQSGLGVMQAQFNQDVDRLCGLSGRHNSDQGYRHGRRDGIVGLGGRRIPITRPRVRSADGSGELPVDSYEELRGTDLLGRMALEPELEAVDAQHHRQRVGPPSTTRLRVEGRDAPLQLLPRDQLLHALEEPLAPRLDKTADQIFDNHTGYNRIPNSGH